MLSPANSELTAGVSDVQDGLKEILFALVLGAESAQLALERDPERLPLLLEFVNRTSGAALIELGRLGRENKLLNPRAYAKPAKHL